MIRNAKKYEDRDKELLARVYAREHLENYLQSLRSSVLPSKKLSDDDREQLEEGIREASEWMRSTPKATAEEIQETKRNIEEVANPIVARMYGKSAPPRHEQQHAD